MFGAVHTWVYTIAFLCILAASLLLVAGNIRKTVDGSYVFRWLGTGMTPLFAAFVILLIFQMTPLPDFLISLLSSEAKTAGLASIPASQMIDAPRPVGYRFTLAPYVYPVRMSLIRWTVYGLLFMGLVQTLNTRKRIEAVILCILVVGAFDALYGIMQTYSQYEHIWWLKKYAYIGDVTGTYINRNHFAGLMEMGIVLAVVYAAAFSSLHSQKNQRQRRGKTFKDVILTYTAAGSLFPQRILIVFMGVVMALGLILSASRGGIIATGLALLFLGMMFVFRENQRRKGYVILVLFLLTTAYALPVGIDYTIGRFRQFDAGREDRMVVTKVVWKIFEDYENTGTGIGNFQYSFPKYQDERHKQTFYRNGHNDWVQLLSEAGWLGMILLMAGMGWFLFRYGRRWSQCRDAFSVCIGAGALAALVAIAVHSWSDFNLHIPANFMMLAAVLAIGTSALYNERPSHRTDVVKKGDSPNFSLREKKDSPLFSLFPKRGDGAELPVHELPLKQGGFVPLVLVAALILWSGQWLVRHFVAEAHCNTVPNATLNIDEHPPLEFIEKAIGFDGGNGEYYFKLAMERTVLRDKEARKSGPDSTAWQVSHGPIISALERSIRLNPFNAEAHKRLGWEYTYLTSDPDYGRKWLPAADLSMERAIYMGGAWVQNPMIHVDYGNFWTMRSRAYGFDPPRQTALWNRALDHYRKAIELTENKNIAKEISAYVRNFYPEEEKLQMIGK